MTSYFPPLPLINITFKIAMSKGSLSWLKLLGDKMHSILVLEPTVLHAVVHSVVDILCLQVGGGPFRAFLVAEPE